MRPLLLFIAALTSLLARGGYDASTLLPDIQRLERERAEAVADLLTRLPGLKPPPRPPFAAKDLFGNMPLYTLLSYGRRGPLVLFDHPKIAAYTVCGLVKRRIGPIALRLDCTRPVSRRVLLLDTRSAFEYLAQSPALGELHETRRKKALAPLPPFFKGVGALKKARRDFARHNPATRLPSNSRQWCDAPDTPSCARRLEAIVKAWEAVLNGFEDFRATAFAPLQRPPFITLEDRFAAPAHHKTPAKPKRQSGGFATFSSNRSFNNPPKSCKTYAKTLDRHENEAADIEKIKDLFTLCRRDPSAVPRLPKLGSKLDPATFFPALLAVATQYGFEVVDPKDRYTFETLLQKMLKKGRAQKVACRHGPYWSAAKELLGENADCEGWQIYADPKDEGGAILYHTKTGKGIWQPAHFLAFSRLVERVGQLNQKGARLFALTLRYHRLASKKADKASGDEIHQESLDEAF